MNALKQSKANIKICQNVFVTLESGSNNMEMKDHDTQRKRLPKCVIKNKGNHARATVIIMSPGMAATDDKQSRYKNF